MVVDYQSRITIEKGKRGGKPCIRGLRITVYDVLSWLAEGMSKEKILEDYPELEAEDIEACLQFFMTDEKKPSVSFDVKLPAYIISGVLFLWAITIGVFYWVFLSIEQEDIIFLETLVMPPVLLFVATFCLIGSEIIAIFYSQKECIQEEVRQYTSRLISISMLSVVFFILIVFLIF